MYQDALSGRRSTDEAVILQALCTCLEPSVVRMMHYNLKRSLGEVIFCFFVFGTGEPRQRHFGGCYLGLDWFSRLPLIVRLGVCRYGCVVMDMRMKWYAMPVTEAILLFILKMLLRHLTFMTPTSNKTCNFIRRTK